MKFEQILQTFSSPTCNHLSVNIFPSPSLLKATLNRTSVITRRECCRDIPSSIYENNEKKERKRRRKKKIASIQLRYDCAQKQRTSVKKNEETKRVCFRMELVKLHEREEDEQVYCPARRVHHRPRGAGSLRSWKKNVGYARGWGRIDREEIVAAVNSLWWPIQGKPWRGSLSRPQTHPSTAESYDWRIVLARGGELRDRTAISIPLVPFLYCCLLRSRFARLSTVVLEIFYILVKSSELF